MSKILIGVDATARSEDAIAFARSLAPAEFVVATVGPSEQAEGTVAKMAALLGGPVDTRVLESRSPAHGLHDLAEADDVALIVVGSTHTGHLGRVRPGSTGERLLAGAPCAVAVAPYGFRTRRDQPLTRIGVAYDGSADSRIALDAAAAFGRPLQVITVVPSDLYSAGALMAGYAGMHAEIERDIRADLETTVAGIPDAVGVVLEGRPWRELAAKSAELDLLFVGSRGYGPLQAVLLGGTSGPLLREAHCPVIALPRGTGAGLAELLADQLSASAT